MDFKHSIFCTVLAIIGMASAIPTLGVSKRILGGFSFSDDSVPFAVFLALFNGNQTNTCGGSFITPNFVVTAAHCVHSSDGKVLDPYSVGVGFGSSNFTELKFVRATKIVSHPDFVPLTETTILQNDIALIEIPKLNISNTIKTVPIFSKSINPGDELLAIGWGATVDSNDPDSMPIVIKGAALSVGDNEICSMYIPGYESPNGPTICTLNSLSFGNGTCKGDSGSGALISVNGIYYLAGMTSMFGGPTSISCGIFDGHVLFTNVKSHLEFISNVTSASIKSLTNA